MKRPKLLGFLALLCFGAIASNHCYAQQAPAEKPYFARMVVANVWPSGYSELWWLDSPEPLHVISNVDVNVFGPGLFFERPEALYDFFIIGTTFTEEDVRQGQLDGSVDARGVPKEWPPQLPPADGAAQFLAFPSGATAAAQSSDDWGICDLLHRYYQANRAQIDAQAQERARDEAIAAAAEAARRAAIPPHTGPPVLGPIISGGVPLGAASSFGIDGNGNGMSDVWEQKYGVPADAGAAHYDGDGFSNQQESALGTDPRDRLSRAHLEVLSTGPNEVPLRIETQKGKRYQVWTSYDLANWTPVGMEITGTGEPITVSPVRAPTAEKAFFRYQCVGDIDFDGDGLSAWEEHQLGSRDDSLDSDGDGMPDRYEWDNGLSPGTHDGSSDADGDGVSNIAEYQAGTNPRQFNFVTGTTVGTTAGKLSVGNNGGASYSIPIAVSPGTAGVQPKLSFEYSSRGGNGIMGVGWSVSGLSAITRVPQTLAQDNAVRGVSFTADDRFAMDGQRLIEIAPGEFRTEMESFTRVTAQGLGATGPQSFKAETKSGLIYTFGETAESRFLAQGRGDGAVLSWALEKIADRSGNSILFKYTRDQNNGEYLIQSIEYAKALPEAYPSVEFVYEARPDQAIGYVAGSKTSLTKRLARLRTKFGAQIVREYTLAYEPGLTATGKSRLKQIQESAGGLFFNPTTFLIRPLFPIRARGTRWSARVTGASALTTGARMIATWKATLPAMGGATSRA